MAIMNNPDRWASSDIGTKDFECENVPEFSGEGCPPQISDFNFIVLRIFTVAITLIGLILLVMIIKNGFGIMFSQDEEAKAKSMKGMQNLLFGFIGILAAYGLIVFIAYRLGMADGPLSFVKSGRIIFDIMLP